MMIDRVMAFVQNTKHIIVGFSHQIHDAQAQQRARPVVHGLLKEANVVNDILRALKHRIARANEWNQDMWLHTEEVLEVQRTLENDFEMLFNDNDHLNEQLYEKSVMVEHLEEEIEELKRNGEI